MKSLFFCSYKVEQTAQNADGKIISTAILVPVIGKSGVVTAGQITLTGDTHDLSMFVVGSEYTLVIKVGE